MNLSYRHNHIEYKTKYLADEISHIENTKNIYVQSRWINYDKSKLCILICAQCESKINKRFKIGTKFAIAKHKNYICLQCAEST